MEKESLSFHLHRELANVPWGATGVFIFVGDGAMKQLRSEFKETSRFLGKPAFYGQTTFRGVPVTLVPEFPDNQVEVVHRLSPSCRYMS